MLKKLSFMSLFALSSLMGCSPSDQLCAKQQECSGEDVCGVGRDGLSEDAKACEDECRSFSDAVAACVLEHGTCERVSENIDTKAFRVDGDACDADFDRHQNCQAGCG